MFKSPFFRRLYVPYLLLVCAVALIIGSIGANRLHEAHIDQAESLLRNTALVTSQLLTQDLERGGQALLQEKVKTLGQKLGYRITIIGPDPEGHVLADSEANPRSMEPHRFRPEVITAYTNGEGSSIRPSDTLHKDLLYYALRIQINGQIAFIRLAIHLDDLNASLRAFYLSIAIATIACMFLAGLVAYFVARRQAMPMVEITGFADAVARGQLDHRILRSDQGEMGDLARSLNSMADSFTRLLAAAERDKADLQAMLASMSEGVVATDGAKRILLVNESASKLLQLPAEAAGKLVWEVIRNDQIIKAVDEVAASGQRRQFQLDPVPNRHFDVIICPVSYTATTQKVPGLVIVVHDITQAMRYQDLRKEFVANVSHELRTPLTVIKGYVETLRDGAIDDTAKRDEYLATIERHANQLTNLVSDLLELSRLDNQSTLPRRTSVDLGALCRRAADLLAPAIAAKDHTLSLDVPGNMPPVLGNADYLERSLVNLLDNAIKYTPAGGKICIAIRLESPNAVIEVADNGIGIPKDDLPRLFERFYRVDRSRSREMGGTGLGLSIVKHVVQAHGGTVDVSSELNSGSRFRITLPLANQI